MYQSIKISILLLFVTSLSFSQEFRFDIGGGTLEKLINPMLVLDMIEKDVPIDIKTYFLNPENLNKEEWNRYRAEIFAAFPNDDNSLPSTDIKESEDLWYERTYCRNEGTAISYHFQVYFELVEINDSIKIKMLNLEKEI